MIRGSRPQPVPPAPTELLLVTRMGDSTSPILLTDVPQPIATFNRPFELSELVGNLDAIFFITGVATYSVNCIEISEESSTKYVLGQSAETYFAELSVEGSSLYAKANGLGTYLVDLDFDHQFRRSLPASGFKYNVQNPQLLGNPSAGQGIGIQHNVESPNNFNIFANGGTPLIVNGDTLQNEMGAWANNMQFSEVQSLLRAIIKMEFEGFDSVTPYIAIMGYNESYASGFTVTPLIPQTLS